MALGLQYTHKPVAHEGQHITIILECEKITRRFCAGRSKSHSKNEFVLENTVLCSSGLVSHTLILFINQLHKNDFI